MKRMFLSAAIIIAVSFSANAQKYYTKNGNISFFSKASLENIQADNNQVMSVLNTQTGDMQFSVLIKSFHFEKALMEEHFNENYLESDKFPKATFKGVISDVSKISFTTDGMYSVSVSGDLTLHGVTKKITSTGTITVKGGKISADSKFNIKLADYNVSIPKLVKDNIAESVEVKVVALYDQKM
ncbi:MAG: YceI family protein [Ferruginibacter sp.]